MKSKLRVRLCWLLSLSLPLPAFALACASSQRPAPTAEEVRDGEALPPAPPVPAEPASTDSPTAPTVPGGTAASPPSEPAPAKESLSEGQLAALSELLNTAELEQARLAQAKGKSPAVKKFAAMMVKHHGIALREQVRLAKKLGLKPADSATAQALKADAAQTLDMLTKTKAADFDAAYVKSQIEGHQKVLDLIDTQALPAAKTPEVADAVRHARTVVEQHLQEARALQ